MTPIAALTRAASILRRQKKMCLLFWAINFASALLLIAPIFFLLQSTLKRSQVSEQLFRQVDLAWFIEWTQQNPGFLTPSLVVFVCLALFTLLLHTFLAGGVLAIVHSDDKTFTLSRFFAGAGKYFPRFLRLLLFSLLFYILAFIAFRILTKPLARSVADSIHEAPVAYVQWLKTLIGLLLLGLVNALFDYAKIKLVLDDSTRVFRTLWRTIKLFAKKLLPMFGLYLLVAAIGVLFLLLYLGLSSTLSASSTLSLLFLFLLQQAFILAKIWTRLLGYTSQLQLAQHLHNIEAPITQSATTVKTETKNTEKDDSTEAIAPSEETTITEEADTTDEAEASDSTKEADSTEEADSTKEADEADSTEENDSTEEAKTDKEADKADEAEASDSTEEAKEAGSTEEAEATKNDEESDNKEAKGDEPDSTEESDTKEGEQEPSSDKA